MLRHTITGLIIDCTEAKREHCQLSFLMFYAIIHPEICIVNTKIRGSIINVGVRLNEPDPKVIIK